MSIAVQPAVNLNEIAASWREARRLYPIYAALIRQFDIGVAPNKDLESPINRSEVAALQRITKWFEDVDTRCEVWQLRQVMQTAAWLSDEQLRSIVRRHLAKKTRDASLRDKVDYLLVQYYAHHCPEDAHNRNITFAHVADILHEITGRGEQEPNFASELNSILDELASCSSLKDLIGKKIIERTRAIKETVGGDYFASESLIAFARFNFVLRLGFFRLMHADLHAIRAALHEMEQRGQSVCDCANAGLSSQEALKHIAEICHEWKKPFRAKYAAAANFQQIISLRESVEAALKLPPPVVKSEPAPVPSVTESAPPVTSKFEVPASPKLTGVEECIEQIAERLLHTSIKNASVTNLMFGSLKVMLASWEVAAFTRGGDEVSDTLQRGVAARVSLQLAMEEKKQGNVPSIKDSISAAHAEAAQLQERIAIAKERKDIDAAVNLAASSKRLLAVIAEVEQLG